MSGSRSADGCGPWNGFLNRGPAASAAPVAAADWVKIFYAPSRRTDKRAARAADSVPALRLPLTLPLRAGREAGRLTRT